MHKDELGADRDRSLYTVNVSCIIFYAAYLLYGLLVCPLYVTLVRYTLHVHFVRYTLYVVLTGADRDRTLRTRTTGQGGRGAFPDDKV